MTQDTIGSQPGTGLALRSLVTAQGQLELSLIELATPAPAEDEVVLQVQATPLNPSDLGLLFGAADMRTAVFTGTGAQAKVTAQVPAGAMSSMTGRFGKSIPVGNEGAGIVVAAGDSSAARALLGKTVAVMGGGMYAQYRCVKAEQCLVLPDGASAADGASCFINPLTALAMVETMRLEGHKALVHTAAASNLGQMLNKLCIQDGIGLVSIVRKPEQEALLRSQGAVHVCSTSSPHFMDDLTQALAHTGATLVFDATGGGKLAGQVLHCMEAALASTHAQGYSRYGTSIHKQAYLYGTLDTSPTEFRRSFGMSWGMGGWLVFEYLKRVDAAAVRAMRQRVVSELKTTFASSYAKEISLQDALKPQEIAAYARRATGDKYLINPSRP